MTADSRQTVTDDPRTPSVEARVREFLETGLLVPDAQTLGSDDSFIEQGVLDSTNVLELVAHLEKTFGIRVRDEELTPDNLDSLSKIGSFVRNKLSEPA